MKPAAILMRLLLTAGVSALLIGLLFSLVAAVSPTELPAVTVMFQTVSIRLMVFALLLALVQAWLRGIRYRMLLATAMEPGTVPGHGHMFLVTLARNMLVDMVPARIGELGYVGLLNKGCKVSAADGLSSLAVSFVFDLIALAGIVMLMACSAALTLGGRELMWIIGGLCLVAALGWGGLFFGVPLVLSMLRRFPVFITRLRLWDKMISLFEHIATAIMAARKARITGRLLGLSMLIRACKYGGMFLCFLAVTRATFPEMAKSEPWRVLAVQLSSEFASSLPMPTFMGFGSYEMGGTAAWTAFGINAGQASRVVLVIHICSQIIDYSLGCLGLIAFFWTIRRVPATAATVAPRSGRRLLVAASVALVLLAAAAYAGYSYRKFMKLGSVKPPEAGHAVATVTGFAQLPLLTNLNARIVWSSNRDGQHDLYQMTLPSGAIRRLTTNLHVETFAAYSPDGRQVAFSRSQIPWVSQRNSAPWDVYLLDLTSGQERLLSSNAFSPRWLDVHTVIFERGSRRVIACDTETGVERILAAAGVDGIPENAVLTTPDIDRKTLALSLTVRGAQRMTAIKRNGSPLEPVGGGCQITWLPDGSGVYWVDHGGKGKNRFYLRRNGQPYEPMLDLPEPFSHEYFPRFSPDGQWLVMGASTGGHEHDTANYEIFLWKTGTADTQAVRLTHHTGNDCWPDIFIDPPFSGGGRGTSGQKEQRRKAR